MALTKVQNRVKYVHRGENDISEHLAALWHSSLYYVKYTPQNRDGPNMENSGS